ASFSRNTSAFSTAWFSGEEGRSETRAAAAQATINGTAIKPIKLRGDIAIVLAYGMKAFLFLLFTVFDICPDVSCSQALHAGRRRTREAVMGRKAEPEKAHQTRRVPNTLQTRRTRAASPPRCGRSR